MRFHFAAALVALGLTAGCSFDSAVGVVDPYRIDVRWDYVYRLRSGRGEAQQRVISLHFDGDVLDRVEGDVEGAQSGTGADGASASAAGRSRVVEIPPVEAR